MLKAAGLTGVTFHHGRHTAITTLAEKGIPDEVIRAQVGHVSPMMMKTYSHIRRNALNQAALALEPSQRLKTPVEFENGSRERAAVPAQSTAQPDTERPVNH